MPRVLSRLPYGAKSEPVEEFAFEEETDGHKGEKYGWMNAAYAMAANINRAFKEYGWTVRIRGVESGGEVMNLPTHTFPTDDGGVDLKCPTEIAITDRREAELSKAGLISIIHRKNTDKAAFIGAQSVYKPKLMDKPEATASDNLSARIPYMFAVSRFAHYLKCMVRDKIGSTKEKDQLEKWLNELDHALRRRRSEELERGGQGAQAAGGGEGHGHPERRKPGLLLGERLPASAFPARGHGHRHEPGGVAAGVERLIRSSLEEILSGASERMLC